VSSPDVKITVRGIDQYAICLLMRTHVGTPIMQEIQFGTATKVSRRMSRVFAGCDGEVFNCLPIMKGWNYMVRLYRPRAKLLNGK
jgi:hypothetical protein